MRSWLLLAAFREAVSDDAAASGAASYWRGGRVQAAEEPNSPAPIIEIEDGQLQIDYQGDAPAQECLEYYLDKLKVEEMQNQVLHEKLATSTRQRSGSVRPRGVLVFLLMENADKVLHKDLALSLRCLARFFWRYPVVIFHTNSTTASELDWMRSVIPGHLHVDFEEVLAHYGSFEAPVLTETSFEEVQKHLLKGRPFVVTDGARGLPMAEWDCEFVRKEFPDSRIRHEGGSSETNGVRMSSDWPAMAKAYPDAGRYPDGAPKTRPFYWDIAKAYQAERERKWGKDPKKVVKKILETSQVPYWLPPQSSKDMGHSSEMWFHPKGAGARAHMDPHCSTTVSFCFSGQRKWRMMVPPAAPHPEGYFDGEIYGARNPERQGEWQPTFELLAPNGSAVVVYPGMVHETVSTGDDCSSSVSQTFSVPTPAAYYRAFWPRFALIGEDVGGCGHVVESLVTLGSGAKVRPAREPAARKAATKFNEKVDKNMDGRISEEELQNGQRKGGKPELAELISFHDTNGDGIVSSEELIESYVMFATASFKASKQGRRNDL
ncbi:unnamed protein product [Symbiodinium microadriaticum]|nr:unnamed protein product [Symbiodinium microadriaticum]